MRGSFERNVGGKFIYRAEDAYFVFQAQGMRLLGWLPLTVNIWQNSGQLQIWLMANDL